MTVKQFRQRAEKCVDHRRVVFICDICGTIFEDRRDAILCEKRHVEVKV